MNAQTLDRRQFFKTSALGYAALTLPTALFGALTAPIPGTATDYELLMRGLLRDWCDALVKAQIDSPNDLSVHGAFNCPACDFIHGRCMDAVYPLLHMAKHTGDERYLQAGIAVFEWSRNVSLDNGAWTVVPDPKSWTGITVFGAIALAETLHYYGDLLPVDTRSRWTTRLRQAADFIHNTFTIDFTNINYAGTSLHAHVLFSRVLDDPKYLKRAHALASDIKAWFTSPNTLLFGEGKPSNAKSPRGLPAVDLGYNVEETLNGITLYALEVQDSELIQLMDRSLASHLEFMLPDGAWDNSWGTRSAKWSYWGSRTTDGCQPAYTRMAYRNPAFGAAAYHNARLLRECTHEGLLHGGPHYVSHGVKPCIHHTFAHAKALTSVLNHRTSLAQVNPSAPLPRATADGIKAFPEVATWLAARGPWRATVTTYDFRYSDKFYEPTGGALAMLWHRAVGPLAAGSMPKYQLAEANNMQHHPGGLDSPLTPHLEVWEDGRWFTNLHDLTADVTATDVDGVITFLAAAQLLDEKQQQPSNGLLVCGLHYVLDGDSVVVRATVGHACPANLKAALVFPVISQTGEAVSWTGDRRVEIKKPQGTVIIDANVPLALKPTTKARMFNLVPGFEAIPLVAAFPAGPASVVEFRLRILS